MKNKYIKQNPEKWKNYYKEWYLKNKEKVKQYNEQNKEKKRLYYAEWSKKNTQRIKDRQADWYLRNKEKVLENIKNWRKNNPDKIKLLAKKTREKYPEKEKARCLLNYALKKGLVVKMPCCECGELKSQAHHADYSKPLEVVWLCSKHHADVHYKKN